MTPAAVVRAFEPARRDPRQRFLLPAGGGNAERHRRERPADDRASSGRRGESRMRRKELRWRRQPRARDAGAATAAATPTAITQEERAEPHLSTGTSLGQSAGSCRLQPALQHVDPARALRWPAPRRSARGTSGRDRRPRGPSRRRRAFNSSRSSPEACSRRIGLS